MKKNKTKKEYEEKRKISSLVSFKYFFLGDKYALKKIRKKTTKTKTTTATTTTATATTTRKKKRAEEFLKTLIECHNCSK